MNQLSTDEEKIIFVLGQYYLFGLEGEGFPKKELEKVTGYSYYRVSKALEVLVKEGLVKVLKEKPMVVMLAEKVADLL